MAAILCDVIVNVKQLQARQKYEIKRNEYFVCLTWRIYFGITATLLHNGFVPYLFSFKHQNDRTK